MQEDARSLKNNVLPFPSLRAAPKDPPPLTAWHVFGALLVLAAAVGLFGLTIYALITL